MTLHCPTNPTLAESHIGTTTTGSSSRSRRKRRGPTGKARQNENPVDASRISQTITGSLPILQDYLLQAVDAERGLVFYYDGGEPQLSADLHVLDTRTMKFTDLSDFLEECEYTPRTPLKIRITKRRLPVVCHAGFTCLNTKLLILFGGKRSVGPSLGPIFINVDDLSKPYWWQDETMADVVSRFDPVIFAVRNQFFVFAGTKTGDAEEPEQIHSWSVANLDDKKKVLNWKAKDIHYPACIPADTIFADSVPIYGGSTIILCPGRKSQISKFEFRPDSMWLFDTEEHGFHPAPATGTFPTGLSMYWTFPLQPTPENPQAVTSSSSRISRASNTHPYPLSSRRAPPDPIRECFVICGWVEQEDRLHPGIWHVNALSRQFKYHKITDAVLGKTGMRRFVVIGHRMYLLGDKVDDYDHDYVMDTYIEIPSSFWTAV